MNEAVLLGKLIFTQLVKFLTFYWHPKVHYHIHKSPSVQGQKYSDHKFTANFCYINFNMILTCMPGSSSWSLPWRFSDQNLLFHIFHVSYTLCSSDPHIIWRLVNGKKYEDPHYVISSLLGPNIHPTLPPSSPTPLAYVLPSSPKVKGRILHPLYKTSFA